MEAVRALLSSPQGDTPKITPEPREEKAKLFNTGEEKWRERAAVRGSPQVYSADITA